jgi:CopG family nickel-responsive transcriptional regulator
LGGAQVPPIFILDAKFKMTELVRFGISVNNALLTEFDDLCERLGYASRSEALRNLMRDKIAEEQWSGGEGEIAATITLLYDHDSLNMSAELTHLQHQHFTSVVSTLHIHIDQHNCLEVLVLRGSAREIKQIAQEIVTKRGVKQGKLSAILI